MPLPRSLPSVLDLVQCQHSKGNCLAPEGTDTPYPPSTSWKMTFSPPAGEAQSPKAGEAQRSCHEDVGREHEPEKCCTYPPPSGDADFVLYESITAMVAGQFPLPKGAGANKRYERARPHFLLG